MASSPDPDISFNMNNNETNTSTPAKHHSAIGHGDQPLRMSAFSVPIAPTRLPHVEPDHFSGAENFEEYMSHCEDCAELSSWSERVKVLVLSSKLRGNARNFYLSLGEDERRSYSILVERLSDRFGGNKHQSLWLSKLDNRRRGRAETIAALAYDLRHLAQMAYADLDRHAQERLALNQLFKQIPVEMQCRCIDRGCSSIADAVNVIEQYEGAFGSGQPQSSDVDVNPLQKTVTMEERLNQMQTRLYQLEKSTRPVTQEKHFRSNSRLCFGCNSPEHFWRNCPNNVHGRTVSAPPKHSDFKQRYQYSERPQQPFPSVNTSHQSGN